MTDLSRKGHRVTLLKTSTKLHNENFEFLNRNKEITIREGESAEVVPVYEVTRDFERAFDDASIIIVYIQTNFHEDFIRRMIKYLSGDEIILFETGYLSTVLFLKHSQINNYIIIEADSSPIDCRIIEPGVVEVLFRNVVNPIGVFPREHKHLALNRLSVLGYNFQLRNSVIESALHNPNLIVHTIGAIMSVPRIEFTSGEYWMYKEVFTPGVWNLVESLDTEKMNVLAKLGYERISYVDSCKLRNSLDQNLNAIDVFFDYAQNSSPKGPTSIKTRFITEDVPEGFVLMESLGKFLDVSTKTCSALIDLASAILNRDFRNEGRSLDRLGVKNLTKIIEDGQ